jgi:hypothetical protein
MEIETSSPNQCNCDCDIALPIAELQGGLSCLCRLVVFMSTCRRGPRFYAHHFGEEESTENDIDADSLPMPILVSVNFRTHVVHVRISVNI